MKTIRFKHAVLGACAALALAAPAGLLAQTADITMNTFDSALSGVGVEWGTGVVTWDATGNPGGSALIDVAFAGSSDTPASDYFCFNGGNPWYQPFSVNAALYSSVDFDIKYDNTSDVTIPQFNDLSTWDTTMTNKNGTFIMQSWAGSGYLNGSLGGLDMNYCGSYNQMAPSFASTNIPAAAAGGWTHVSLPINISQANIGSVDGIVFHKWINQSWGILNTAHGRFWVDNIVFKGTALPPPPPTMVSPAMKAQPGLNIWTASGGLYDRQEVCSLVTNGLSWVGHATAGNPVDYSFTVTGYPNSQNCEIYFLLSPNPAYMDNALDWNETNVVYFEIQGGANNATGSFKYKVNEPGGQNMYNSAGIYIAAPGSGNPESGALATVSPVTGGVFGTWHIKFTSNSAGEIIAPDSTHTFFTFPAYNAALFAESPGAGMPGMYLYLGGQANQLDGQNGAFVFSNISVSGGSPALAGAFTENFLTETVLDTTNKWARPGSAPLGAFIMPAADAGYPWASWTLPAAGFSLQVAGKITDSTWSNPSLGPTIGMAGVVRQFVGPSELPAGNQAYFRMIQRTFTKLQILLPGMTATPNVSPGYSGTPTAQQADDVGDYPFNVIVNSVSPDWYVVNGATDTIALSCPDLNFLVASTPQDLNLNGGTVTFSVVFLADGSSQITAQDISDPTKTSSVSPTVAY